jgi:polysaccharide pyruvyl transferase WcaK-like protein
LLIHHFYPKTSNLGDHFVQRGVASLFSRVAPNSEFETFNVNDRGDDQTGFGLTLAAVDRANRRADLVVIGGSNLYEGDDRWGVYLEPGAIDKLSVPLILLGIGTGSTFRSRPPRPSERVKSEILALNNYAVLSGVRDVITLDWLRQLGVGKVKLTGDPATFIFNRPLQPARSAEYVVIAIPPIRFWQRTSRREFFDPRRRKAFRALVSVRRHITENGLRVIIACNDTADLELARTLFAEGRTNEVVCPESAEHYFELLSEARAVIAGRLHTAVASFSLGVPFILLDVDQRTSGFIKTYGLQRWSAAPSLLGFDSLLAATVQRLFDDSLAGEWEDLIAKRDVMHGQALNLLSDALK